MALHVAARFTKTSNQWIQMVNAFNQALKVGSMGQPNSHVSICIEMLRRQVVLQDTYWRHLGVPLYDNLPRCVSSLRMAPPAERANVGNWRR